MPRRFTPLQTNPTRHYYVEGGCGWFVVHCANKRVARSIGVSEFGRGGVRTVRPASAIDVDAYLTQRWYFTMSALPFEEYP